MASVPVGGGEDPLALLGEDPLALLPVFPKTPWCPVSTLI